MATGGVFLGFDYGRRHIGVAVGQALTRTATGLETLDARDGIPDWDRISRLVNEWQPEALVVGIPYLMDGGSSTVTKAAEKFALALQNRYGMVVHHQDERLSSREAESVIAQRRGSGKMARKDADTDQLAAQIILQNWLEK